MKNIIPLLIFAWIAGLLACQNHEDPTIVPPDPSDTISETDKNWDISFLKTNKSSKHFITVYSDPMRFAGRIAYDDPKDWFSKPSKTEFYYFYIWSDTEIEKSIIDKYPGHSQIHNCQPKRFDSIARAVGDTLNDKPYENSYYWWGNSFLFRTCKFHITTLDDYDENHPAGTTLDDITQIHYYTAKPYIKSNYKNKRLADVRLYTIELISQFNEKHIHLLQNDMSFRISKRPAVTGHYSFLLTYNDISGKSFTLKTVPLYMIARDNLQNTKSQSDYWPQNIESTKSLNTNCARMTEYTPPTKPQKE